MKKSILSLLFASLIIVGCGKGGGDNNGSEASADSNGTFEKQGFLTTKWCMDQGMFQDCRLESVVCGEGECYQKWEVGDEEKTELVLYSHDDLQYYKLDISKFKNVAGLIEEGISKDQVMIKGDLSDNNKTIIVKNYEAPPPPAKSFFKGCL
ncbi:MAG: hypothetical protein PHI02_08390 [Sulfurovaceae bacterium]|nr:hypothetical protein [Sulfurovaceae bacterium]